MHVGPIEVHDLEQPHLLCSVSFAGPQHSPPKGKRKKEFYQKAEPLLGNRTTQHSHQWFLFAGDIKVELKNRIYRETNHLGVSSTVMK